MLPRQITDSVYALSAVDWDRRLFDSLIPLPDGTSYNAYLIRGSQKTMLLDSADPKLADALMSQLVGIDKIDYVVSHHTEQDHSGAIPAVLARYPGAHVLCSPKAKSMLVDHLCIPENSITPMDDGQSLSLGGKTVEFIHTPWVHWPETMCTFLREDKILFSCDFFGSHLATSDLFVTDNCQVYEAAKRYYAEIMMPFRSNIRRNIERIERNPIEMIAPSHGPIYHDPGFIITAYQDWIADAAKNSVVLPYVSMHGSTQKMVDFLVESLSRKGVTVHRFELSSTDIGKLAICLVDAATIVLGAPTVHIGPHPLVMSAASLANNLKPKAKFVSIVGSFGWATKVVEQLAGAIGNLKVEVIPPVLCKGYPRQNDFDALERLAAAILEKHKSIGIA